LPTESDSETGAATSAEELARQEKHADRTEYKRFHHRSSRVKRCVQDLCAASQWKVGIYIVTAKGVVYTHGNLEYDEFFTWTVLYGHKSNIHLSKDQGQQLETLRVKYGIQRFVTWHLELLVLQAHALVENCNVRVAMLIACGDEPLTITGGNLRVGEIGYVEVTFRNSLHERQREFEQGTHFAIENRCHAVLFSRAARGPKLFVLLFFLCSPTVLWTVAFVVAVKRSLNFGC
jgi:hypothetical protein